MILNIPDHFGKTQWFIITAIFFGMILFKLLPKRFPTSITAIIVLYSIAMPKIMDHTIAVEPLNLYDLTDSRKLDLFDVILDGVYPAFGYLFIYLFDYFQFKKIGLVIYIIVWSAASLGLEFIATQFHVYNYHGWKLIYSLPIYTIIMIINLILFNYCMKYFHTNFQKS